MNEMERMIIELNKRIQIAEAQNQQMERRVKELEGQTNSLGIIEPGQEDFLVGGMILITNGVTVGNQTPGQVLGPGLFTRREGFGGEGDDAEDWLIAKLPQPTDKFESFIAQVTARSDITFPEDSGGGSAGIVFEVYGIQEDFNIDDVTFVVAEDFDIKLIGSFSISAAATAEVIEGESIETESDFIGASGFIDTGFPGNTPDSEKRYFGILIKTSLVNSIAIGRADVFGSIPAGTFSVGFYSPNTLLS